MVDETLTEPLSPALVKQLVRRIMEEGTYFSSHPYLLGRLEERRLTQIDIENVLRAGAPQPGEYENGAWRYQIQTSRMCVVIEFDLDGPTFTVVTAWRFDSLITKGGPRR